METAKYIWMDGKLVKWDDAKIHVMTHSFHYGSAVFEGIRFYNINKNAKHCCAIFRLEEHIERLFYSANKIGLKIKYSKEEIKREINKTVKANNIKNGYIRPIVYYGYGSIEVVPTKNSANFIIAVWPWKHSMRNKLLRIKISPYIRIHHKSTDINAKISGNYANSILAGLDAKKSGYDEAVMLDYDGNIAEATSENIFIVKNEKLLTPKSENILPGITRDSIIQIAKDNKIKVAEKDISVHELLNSDEIFLAATAAEIIGVSSVNDKIVSEEEGIITKKIRKIFHSAITGKIKKYDKWLNYI